jgi:hypothetical protein
MLRLPSQVNKCCLEDTLRFLKDASYENFSGGWGQMNTILFKLL